MAAEIWANRKMKDLNFETGQTVKVSGKWFNVIKHDADRAMLEIAEWAGYKKKWQLHKGVKKGQTIKVQDRLHLIIGVSSGRITLAQKEVTPHV